MHAVITFGLPGSGKSTWAFTKNGLPVISADQIKRELPGYSDENHGDFYQKAVALAEDMVYHTAYEGKNFVLDSGSINSNYTLRIIKQLKDRGYVIHLKVFNAPVDVCIERDKGRPQSVGESVIRAKAEKAPQALYNIVQLLTNSDTISVI